MVCMFLFQMEISPFVFLLVSSYLFLLLFLLSMGKLLLRRIGIPSVFLTYGLGRLLFNVGYNVLLDLDS